VAAPKALDKRALFSTLLTALRQEFAAAERAARESAEAANHPEARPENDKDTRKIELSYLAAGQAARARELEAGIAMVESLAAETPGARDQIMAGAVVTLDVAGKRQCVILSPAGGGLKLEHERGAINVVTPVSPLGKALLGRTAGESFELVLAGRSNEVEILSVE
jgi:transcription elongation GreA/GreB family factor